MSASEKDNVAVVTHGDRRILLFAAGGRRTAGLAGPSGVLFHATGLLGKPAGRLMVIATYNSDYGDAWEYMDAPCYPEKYSGQAYRMGLNIMIYAMTH